MKGDKMFLTVNINFGEWLIVERGKRNWSQADLSRYSGLHRAVISKLESGTRPMPETLIAIANAFKMSPITIFRIAGLLPDNGSDQIKFEDWQYLLSQLTEDEQEEIRKIIEFKIERRQKAEQEARAKNLKPRKAG
jgi:transcriptional regulator with XRE-family HTH domain